MPGIEEKSGSKMTDMTTDVTIAVLVFLVALGVFGVYFERIIDWFRALVDWFNYGSWKTINQVLGAIFSLIIAALVVFMANIVWRYFHLEKTVPQQEAEVHVVSPKIEIKESWEHIKGLANSSSPSDWNMAVLRADALLDDVLQHLGYEGLTIAERLKLVDSTKLPSVDEVWSAHRLRNMIAHDPMEKQTRESIIHALRVYEKAFKELGMMEETQ